MSTEDPISPVPGLALEGYGSQVSLNAGEPIRVMLSGLPGVAHLRVVRLLHGDPSSNGPGVQEEPATWGAPRELALRGQHLDLGSFIEVPDHEALSPHGDFTIALWVYPTLLNRLWQALAAKWTPGALSFGMFLGGHHTLSAAVSHDGETVRWATGRNYLWPDIWQLVAMCYKADSGELQVHQYVKGEAAHGAPRHTVGGPIHRGSAPLLLGALPQPDSPGHWAHFNGRLAAPVILAAALEDNELAALAGGASADQLGPVIAAWDLSRDVHGGRVVDSGRLGLDGRAVNAPDRAVTGPRWSGSGGSLCTDDPDSYDAVHLHDDDIDDARWEVTSSISVPADARAGIYAVRCRQGHDELVIPVVVRQKTVTDDLCFLVPTYTWQAYGTNRARHSYTEDGVFDRGVCLYDVHSDGSMVRYCTRRKPTRSGNPATGLQWGAHNVTANLYLIDWLEKRRIAYNVCSDEQLHHEGLAALSAYRCLLLGSHPEYWTQAMLSALRAYLAGGGRVMYLGGNGLYWVTSVDARRPWLIEVRKSGDGDFEDNWSAPRPGETQHSTTLEVGGLWSRRAFPPRSLVGVEMATSVFEQSAGRWGYRRMPASWEPPYEFVFEGVEDEIIGNFGLNLGTAAGYEMDAVQDWTFGPAETVLLARATHPMFLPQRRMPAPSAADLALSIWPGGGAVFAAGAVSWTGSLSHQGYENSVSQVTENVLRRFLSTPHGTSVVDSPDPREQR